MIFCIFFCKGTKFQSNLNEIGKSEQKSSETDRKRPYEWPPAKGESNVSLCKYVLFKYLSLR